MEGGEPAAGANNKVIFTITTMANVNQFKAEEFIKAIPGTGGIISTIARRVGCEWHTAQKYIREHPTVQLAYDDECEGILDLAEAKLIGAINESDLAAIKFYLMTKGKRRGYTEKQEVEHSGSVVSAVVETKVDNVDELRQFIEAVKESVIDFTRAASDEIHTPPPDA